MNLKVRESLGMSGKKFSPFYNVYVKAVGKSVIGPGAFGAIISGEMSNQIVETSGIIEGYGINARECVALNSIFDRMGGRGESEVTCYFNNKTVVDQLNDRANVWNVVLEELISSLREKERLFLNVKYENVSRDDSWIIRTKHLGELHFNSHFRVL